ncbi:MAG: heavy-metal-associated domain-containing protein [Myxococcota bacterium]
MTQSYRVDGMTCDGCASSVTKAIEAAKPGAEVVVEVDLEAKKVTVAGLDDDQVVADAVTGAGFDFGGRITISATGTVPRP